MYPLSYALFLLLSNEKNVSREHTAASGCNVTNWTLKAHFSFHTFEVLHSKNVSVWLFHLEKRRRLSLQSFYCHLSSFYPWVFHTNLLWYKLPGVQNKWRKSHSLKTGKRATLHANGDTLDPSEAACRIILGTTVVIYSWYWPFRVEGQTANRRLKILKPKRSRLTGGTNTHLQHNFPLTHCSIR